MKLKLLLLGFLIVSCKADTDVVNISVSNVPNNTISAEALFCESKQFQIETSHNWNIVTEGDWFVVSPSSGEGNVYSEIDIKFKNCNYGNKREGKLTIICNDKFVELTIIQEGYNPIDLGFNNPESIVAGHPKLLATGSDFTNMRYRVAENTQLKVINDYIIKYANDVLSMPVNERVITGTRLLDVSVENLKRIFYLSYAYRFTGDDRYAIRAEKEMVKIASFEDWHPSHFLDVAEMTMAMAIGYDWCYDTISQTNLTIIKNAIIEKGLIPFMNSSYDSWSYSDSNWNQVCNGCAIYGAIAISDTDKDLAKQVLDKAVGSIGVAMNGYSPDGAYREGPGYWCYGTSYNVLFLDAIKRYYGDYRSLLDTYPDFLKTVDYENAVITPSYRVFTYSDQGFLAQVSIVPFFMYDLTDNSSYLYTMNQLVNRGILNYDHCRHERLLPASLIFAGRKTTSISSSEKPSSLAYIGGGATSVAIFRGSWDERTSPYLGLKLGFPACGHGHMDIGSFFFEADGIQWSTDMGGENYNALEQAGVDLWNTNQDSDRWNILRCALKGHSCLIFNGENQLVNANATINGYSITNPSEMYAESDLSALYTNTVKSVSRKVSLLDGKYAVVQDKIETNDNSVLLRWNMCTEATDISFDGKSAILSVKTGQKLYLTVETSAEISFKIWSGQPSSQHESSNTQQFVGFESTLAANKSYDIKVTLSPKEPLK